MRVGINGMGRIGRLALRAAMGGIYRGADDPRAGNRLEVVHINELKGGAATTAHLLEFDSIHGRWREQFNVEGERAIHIGGRCIGFSEAATPDAVATMSKLALEEHRPAADAARRELAAMPAPAAVLDQLVARFR